MRTCSKCGKEKSDDKFYSRREGWRLRTCKECVRAASRAWRDANVERVNARVKAWNAANPERVKANTLAWQRANPESRRSSQLKHHYGITLQEWGVMLGKQEGLCAICCSVLDRGMHTHVDHDHNTGKVRALLCSQCNKGIGCFRDDAENLVLAAKYIQDHAARAVA